MTEIPVIQRDEVPAVTAEQMREVDRIMIEDLHIELIQMMENAGRNLAELAIRLFGPRTATVLAGPGGNGGGGLVAARHLVDRGVRTAVVPSAADSLAPVPAHQLDILQRMGVEVQADPESADLVVDALIGYGLRGDPSGRAGGLIEWANGHRAPVLALDTPSGLDVTTGQPGNPCIRAAATLTLALPKIGLLKAPEYVGTLYLADISVPSRVYERIGLTVPTLFAGDSIVELTG